MNVYINGIKKDVLILGNENEVLDETLDSATFSYIDSNPLPLAPYQRVEIRHENMPSTFFVTISDSVEPYTPTSNLYKHEVTCAESTRILSKRMLRNSVFSQPPSLRIGRLCVGARADTPIASHRRYSLVALDSSTYYASNGYAKHLTIPSGEKCSRCYIRITTQIFQGAINDSNWTILEAKRFKTYEDFLDNKSIYCDWRNNGILVLHYKDANNVSQTENLQLDSTIQNGAMDCPRIKELLNSGATDIYLKTSQDYPFYYKVQDGFEDDTEIDGYGDHVVGFSVQFEIVAETYIHTAYSVLAEIINRVKQPHQVWSQTGYRTLMEREAPFSLPQSGELYTLLNNTITPNMTFTQCSVYEAVAEVFRLFDAIFTMDEDGVLGITYFNEKTGTATISNKAVAINSAIGEERYINGLMCYYQDARAKVAFPQGGNVFSYTSSKEIGVVSYENHIFRTPSPIHDVIGFWAIAKIDIMIVSSHAEIDNYEINMTDYVFEKSIWSATLDVSDSFPTTTSGTKQMNTITYAKGDDYIDLSYSFKDSWGHLVLTLINATSSALCLSLGKSQANQPSIAPRVLPVSQGASSSFVWSIPRYRIEYHTIANGVFKVESYANKFDGEMPIDQASGSIDLGKAGLNLLGLSFKMGEPTLNVTHRATSWEARIQKGFVLTYQGEQWTANNCRYTCIAEDTYQGQISFVKNYNELSLNKKVLREKRLSSVSNELTIKSEDILTEYCYVFEKESDIPPISLVYSCMRFDYFYQAIGKSLNAYLNLASTETELETLNDSIIRFPNETKNIFLPSVRYGAGDVICFEMSYDDPMVAGIRFTAHKTGWFGTDRYYSDYILYSDAQGKVDKFDVGMMMNTTEQYTLDFPLITETYPSLFLRIQDYQVHKQPNEVFALNYQIAFIPKHPNKVIIGKAFIEDNFLVSGKVNDRKLYLNLSNDSYSVMDTKGKGTRHLLDHGAMQVDYYGHPAYCELSVRNNFSSDFDAWAICDENGNILFACNEVPQETMFLKLYFVLTATRL